MLQVNGKTITDYGKSMYGGWYANYRDEQGNWNGYHASTLTVLAEQIGTTRKVLMAEVSRFDN